MRLSISGKVFLAFGVLFLVTVTFGAAVYLGVDRIGRGHERTRRLVAFRSLLADLGHFHADGRFHLNFHEDDERFRSTVESAEALAEEIGSWAAVGQPAGAPRFDLAEQMRFYGDAAEELLAEEARAGRLAAERRELLLGLNAELAGEAARGDAPAAALQGEVALLGMDALGSVTLPVLTRARDLRERIAGRREGSRSAGLAGDLLLSLERSYLGRLAIASRTEFLSDAMRHFETDIRAILEGIERGVTREERQIRTLALAAVLLTALATLLLWYLSSRRISAFVGRFRSSLENIRRGRYDYEIGALPRDELGDSLRFMKELAGSLEEQIREAEKAHEEGEALQLQLVHSQKMESVGRLAGGIAHDFNNLLTGIMGFAELGMLRLEEGQPGREFFPPILENSEKATRLTSQLLALSRRQVLQRRKLDPNAHIGEFAGMLRRVIGEDVRLEIHLGEGVSPILADPDQVDQVLLNLCVNARDSMPGGGRLTISTEDVLLDESYAAHHPGVAPGRYVKIEVTDTGAGIPREIQDKVFEPFFTTKGQGKGTGLGLAMVYGIVKQHEGQVWLYSEVGRGTTFKVYLPTAGDGDGAPEPEVAPIGDLRGSETVLVVDDNADVRAFIETALALHGYTALSASGREEALAHLARAGGAVDVLLTDLVMPDTNGRELAGEVCREHPGLRVIYMSGYADRVFLDGELGQDRAMNFLQKPLTATALLRKIREVCAAPAA